MAGHSLMASVGEDGYVPVAPLKELRDAGRKRVTINERVVILFYVNGEVYALDHFCYRKPKMFISVTTEYHFFTCVGLPVWQCFVFTFCTLYMKQSTHYLYSDAGGPLEMGDIEVTLITKTAKST